MKKMSEKRFEEKVKAYKKIDQIKEYISKKERFVEITTKSKKNNKFDTNKVKKQIVEALVDDEKQRIETRKAFNKLKDMMSCKVRIIGNTYDGTKKNIVLGYLYYKGRTLKEINTIIMQENLGNLDLTDSQVLEEIAERTKANNYKLNEKGKAIGTETVTKFNTKKV